MSKKSQLHIPISLLLITLFIASVTFTRFNSDAIAKTTRSIVAKVSNKNSNKSLGNSKFIATAAAYDSLDNCNVDIKLNNAKLELIPGAPATTNPNIKRYTYKSVDNIAVDGGVKYGSVDIACVNFESTIKQLKTTIETVNKADPAKINAVFGMNMEEVLKLENKALYRMFLIKRGQPNECQESTKTNEIISISSSLEEKLDKEYVDCTFNYKNTENPESKESKIVKFKYLIDKNSKFLLQIGESDADTLKINDQFLLVDSI